MRMHSILFAGAVLALAAVPADARHKHRRDCGHHYSPASRTWVSVGVATPYGAFGYGRGPAYVQPVPVYGPPGYYYGGPPWDPYRWDRSYHKHRGYWRNHHGHHHHYKARCGYR